MMANATNNIVKERAMKVIEALRPMELTIAEVREVLKYINETIEKNVVLR